MVESSYEAQELVDEQKLYINRFGVASNPLRSMDDLMAFIGNQTAFDNTINYISFDESIAATDDVMKGLDSWMSSEDRNMVEYYKRYVKGSH